MASLVWVRRKTNICECCGRVMEVGEKYSGRCPKCGCDFCCNCLEADVCRACAGLSLFRSSAPIAAVG